MRLFSFLLTVLAFINLQAQSDESKALLDSAKVLFNGEIGLYQQELDTFDYAGIALLLEKSIALDFTNPEAHYYLGYTLSRINARDGRSIVDMDPKLVEKSSSEFEKVIALSRKYHGEIITLDPYSKISSEWGSLAMGYLAKNQPDSSKWAFREGRRRGGFSDFSLNLNQMVLKACAKNGILIASGDGFTFPLLYLQNVKKIRPDVAVVDVSLLNTVWYPRYLASNKIIDFDQPESVIDTLDYTQWKDSLITIGSFSWILKPAYSDHYLIRGNRLMLSMLRANGFKRDLYFTIGFREDDQLGLVDYLTYEIVINKFAGNEKPFYEYQTDIHSIKNALKLSRNINVNSQDEIRLYDNLRYNVIFYITHLVERDLYKKANKTLRILEKHGSSDRIPYMNNTAISYIDVLKTQIRTGLGD